MGKDHPEGWQFRFVAQYGPTTDKVQPLGRLAPLRSYREALPVGSNALPLGAVSSYPTGSTLAPILVTGPYIRVKYTLPEDIPSSATFVGFIWDGRLRILRKSREFARDITDANAEVFFDTDFSTVPGFPTGAPRSEYTDQFTLLDQQVGQPGKIWYYTVFYGNAVTGKFTFSQAYGLTRNYAYPNEVDADGAPFSKHGRWLFDQMPRAVKIQDFREGNSALLRLMETVGRLFDGAKQTLDQGLKRYDPDEVDAGYLPYIDWLLAWPTNYELSEEKRRIETKNAALLWKAKGTQDAMELALQTITGWDVELVEGWPWILTTSTAQYDPLTPPPGWNPVTDGDWQEAVERLPFNITWDPTNPLMLGAYGTQADKLCYTPSVEEIVPTGTGQWWQNVNGILVQLREIPGVSTELPETILRKVSRMAPLFAMHYAAFAIVAIQVDEEAWRPLGNDSYEDIIGYYAFESYDEWISELSVTDSTADKCLLYSYPAPVAPLEHISNSGRHYTFHSWLSFECDPAAYQEEVFLMPQFIQLSNDQLLTAGAPTSAVGQFAFDPTDYAGTRVFTFRSTGFIGGPTVGLNLVVSLFDLDNAQTVTGSTLTFTGSSPEDKQSINLVVGSGVGDLKDSLTLYEVRVTLVGGVDPADFGSLGTVDIKVI